MTGKKGRPPKHSSADTPPPGTFSVRVTVGSVHTADNNYVIAGDEIHGLSRAAADDLVNLGVAELIG